MWASLPQQLCRFRAFSFLWWFIDFFLCVMSVCGKLSLFTHCSQLHGQFRVWRVFVMTIRIQTSECLQVAEPPVWAAVIGKKCQECVCLWVRQCLRMYACVWAVWCPWVFLMLNGINWWTRKESRQDTKALKKKMFPLLTEIQQGRASRLSLA